MHRLFARLAHDPAIVPGALIVVRHEYQAAEAPDLSPLVEVDRRDVGKMTFRFATPRVPKEPEWPAS